MTTLTRPRVLCVDDEPAVVAGIAQIFRKELDVLPVTSGAEALVALDGGPPFSVIVSDMHMPKMNGIELLSEVRRRAPDVVRVLLTGNADIETAVAAVNEGQLFRFLRKPAPADVLGKVLQAAVAQHRLLTAERVLLEQTLRGTVEALMDMLSVVSPVAFGQVSLLRRLAHEVGAAVGAANLWQIEVAAMFSQLVTVALAPESQERFQRGAPLDDDEKAAASRGARLVEKLLADIPRLEAVHAIMLEERRLRTPLHKPRDPATALGAEVLRIARDYASLIGQGLVADRAIEALRARGERYDAKVLDALGRTEIVAESAVKEVSVRGLLVGMILAEDLYTRPGALLARRGYAVTESFLERTLGYPRGFVREPIRIVHQPGGSHGV